MRSKNTFTQAVVIVHGIGEQRPMETLRRFADAVLPEPAQGGEKYFSKPDTLSESFELRKLQNRARPKTHIFEYYWAYKIEGSAIGHVLSWLSNLLLRRPSNVPSHLQPHFYLSWSLILSALAAAFFGILDSVTQYTSQFPPFAITVVSTLLFSALQVFVLRFVGDAARYLSPTPQNIKLRHEIRADGIKLLQKLHESGEYDRIILVGHSLGSVIAYDILYHLWQTYNTVYDKPAPSEQPALQQAELSGQTLSVEENAQDFEEKLTTYRGCQLALWKELQSLGNPWLVTDLVTIASPLAHAAVLLARNEDDLKRRQYQRELPTNPPVYESEEDGTIRPRFSYRVWEKYPGDVQLRAIHHAGHFACTRWTNLYYPAKHGFFGDVVGGPLQKWFGYGIRDIAVTSGNWLVRNSLWSHTSYWRTEKSSPNRLTNLPLALHALTAALDLPAESLFEGDNPLANIT